MICALWRCKYVDVLVKMEAVIWMLFITALVFIACGFIMIAAHTKQH